MFLFVFAMAGCDGSGSGILALPGGPNGPPDIVEVDADGNTSVDMNSLQTEMAGIALGTISAAEGAGLVYMREEEKLAHDVYIYLDSLWHHNTFANIAISEQTHTEAVLFLLDRYSITDPVGMNGEGVFSDPALQGLYDSLTARGSASLLDALIVGAEIEEIDLIDLETRLAEVVDNEDIVLVYENLMKGSRNHLRAFVRALEQQNVVYEPQHLSQEEYDAIVHTPIETGRS
jgi:hypothetical protein